MRITVTRDNIVLPFKTLLDAGASSIPWMPEVAEEVDTMPGANGETQMSARYGSANHIIVMRSGPDLYPEEKDALLKDVDNFMAAAKSTAQELHYERLGRTYHVRLVGLPERTQEYTSWLEFRLPLKAHDPLGYADQESRIGGLATADNKGNVPTPARIEIAGPITSPAITINGTVFSYTGTIPSGSTLRADAKTFRTILVASNGNSTDVSAQWSGGYLELLPGPLTRVSAVVGDAGQYSIHWTNRWA